MSKRTPEQIVSEITALDACRGFIPRYNVFGENNFHTLDLQIEELRHGIDDTADEWNDFSEGEQDSILEARRWKEGDCEESPSSGWGTFTNPLE
jgi:hypothetical protein